MNRLILLIQGIVLINSVQAQVKLALDTGAYRIWKIARDPAISNDGKYAMYTICPNSDRSISEKTVIKATAGSWKYEVPGNSSVLFTQDSKFAIVADGNKLNILKLGSSVITNIPEVQYCKRSTRAKNDWLFYKTKNAGSVLRNLKTGKEQSFPLVVSSVISINEELIVFETKNEGGSEKSLVLLNINNGRMNTFWKGIDPTNIIFDKQSSQIAFIANHSIWYYAIGKAKAIDLLENKLEKGFSVGNISGFNKEGNMLIFSIKKTTSLPKPKEDALKLNIWSYADSILQSEQLTNLKNTNNQLSDIYQAIIKITDGTVIRIEQPHERAEIPKGDYFILEYGGNGGTGEAHWNVASKRMYWLCSIKGGEVKYVKQFASQPELSPDGKYVIYYNRKQNHYFSYETATGVTRDITPNISTNWMYSDHEDLPGGPYPRGVAGWFKSGEVFIYDKYDMWKVNPLVKNPPVNVTNGYGSKNNIMFYYALPYSNDPENIFSGNDKLVLTAFNLITKDNGFYRKVLDKPGDPQLLTMGQYAYYISNLPYLPSEDDNPNFEPLKALNAEVYIVKRSNPREGSNFFTTKDLKTFTPLSDVHPEKDFNWYSTELHTWKSLDGNGLQGILYKPENFDPNKKYPVIFHYYERKSDGLNAYLRPGKLSGGCNINIPSYVSKGYLVFSPDIYYTVGDPMQGAYDAIISAAEYVAKMPFVNAKKMGLQGCSFGGLETNYLITHSNLFAAAESSSGVFDFISAIGGLIGNSGSQHGFYETGQVRMGSTLWERPDMYIKNSPIFKADKVTTPFLMMHTTQDGICLFSQAVEFFTALRRLGKTSWMLEYEEGNHGIHGKSADDFSARMMQFFDHYLKDEPAPKWMIEGRPAYLKGIDERMELMPKEIKPRPGLAAKEGRLRDD